MKEIKSHTFNPETCKTYLTSTLSIGDEDKVNLILDFIKRERERYYTMIEECFQIKKVKDEEAARKREEAKQEDQSKNGKKPRTEKKEKVVLPKTPYDFSVETLLKTDPKPGLIYFFSLFQDIRQLNLTSERNNLVKERKKNGIFGRH